MKTTSPQSNSQEQPKETIEAIKVLLADDDEDDKALFKDALNHTPVKTELTTANDGQELMDKLHDDSIPNPDIIFLDINMPKKDGKECLAEIKADENLKEIPCVMYSTSNNEKDIADTFNSGANLYVAKPDSFTKIISVLNHIFTLKWRMLFTKTSKESFVIDEKNIS